MPRKNPCTTLAHQFNKITNAIISVFGFCATNPRWVAQAGLLGSTLIYEADHTYRDLTAQSDTDINYAIARSAGSALKLLTLSTLVPLNRVFYTKIQTSDIGKYFGLDRRIADHKLFGLCMIAVALIHSIAHYLYNPDNYGKQSGISGLFMLASLLIPIAGIFTINDHMKPCATGSWGTLVLGTHRAGAAAFGAIYIFHTADMRMLTYVSAATLSLAIDRMVEFMYFRHNTFINHAKLIADTDFISVIIQKPARFKKYHPGQHAFLSFPAIDGFFELPHPFTIVRCDKQEIEFIIKKTGRWTLKLANFVAQITNFNDATNLGCTVIGPFGDALINHSADKSLTLIGTGVGLTPSLAVLHGLLNKQINAREIALHISQKKLSELSPCINLLSKVNTQCPESIKSVDLYLTDKKQNEQEISKQLNTIKTKTNLHLEIAHTSNHTIDDRPQLNIFSLFKRHAKSTPELRQKKEIYADSPPKINVSLHLHRPHLPSIVANSKNINVCGGKQVSNDVIQLSRRLGRKCSSESF